jgi:hypothetical protein
MRTPDVNIYDLPGWRWTSICNVQTANDEHVRNTTPASLLPMALTVVRCYDESYPSPLLGRTPGSREPLPGPRNEPFEVLEKGDGGSNHADPNHNRYDLVPRHAAQDSRKFAPYNDSRAAHSRGVSLFTGLQASHQEYQSAEKVQLLVPETRHKLHANGNLRPMRCVPRARSRDQKRLRGSLGL